MCVCVCLCVFVCGVLIRDCEFFSFFFCKLLCVLMCVLFSMNLCLCVCYYCYVMFVCVNGDIKIRTYIHGVHTHTQYILKYTYIYI